MEGTADDDDDDDFNVVEARRGRTDDDESGMGGVLCRPLTPTTTRANGFRLL